MSMSGNWSSTFVSSITDDGSVSNGKGGSSSMFFSPAGPSIFARKPLLSGGRRSKEHTLSDNSHYQCFHLLYHSTVVVASAALRRLTTNPTSTKKGHKHRHNRRLTTNPTSTKKGHKHRHNSS
ncbi:putative WRKY transcription factor 17 [Forsythia ovata]|uniref:WRKY transcription factor 17 n=1 Tax=Forsythia ovata TaxID=205694 RepID=A0ABD1UDZ1_9LAMI